ncbi:MAG: hypothetical protein Kow0090_20260 [Myxococcota bacterium]
MKKKIKKRLVGAIFLIIILAFSACEREKRTETAVVEKSEAEKPPELAKAPEKEPEPPKEEPTAEITAVEGSYFVYEGDAEKTVWGDETPKSEMGFKLKEGFKVKTNENSSVTIAFPDKSIAKLGADTELVIELMDAEGEDGISLQLLLGEVYNEVAKILGVKKNFAVSTPTAVAGVRGTKFQVAVAEDCSSLISVEEGEVQVEVEDEKAKLAQNQVTEITPKAVLSPKFKLDVKKAPPKKLSISRWREEKKKIVKKNPSLFVKNMVTLAEKKQERLNSLVEEGEKTVSLQEELEAKIKAARTPQEIKNLGKELEEIKKKHKKIGRKVKKADSTLSGSLSLLSNIEKGKVMRDKKGVSALASALDEKNKEKIGKLKESHKETKKKAQKLELIKGKRMMIRKIEKLKLRDTPAPLKEERKKREKDAEKALKEKVKKRAEKIMKAQEEEKKKESGKRRESETSKERKEKKGKGEKRGESDKKTGDKESVKKKKK